MAVPLLSSSSHQTPAELSSYHQTQGSVHSLEAVPGSASRGLQSRGLEDLGAGQVAHSSLPFPQVSTGMGGLYSCIGVSVLVCILASGYKNECICVRGRESTNKTMIAGLCCTCRRCARAP